MTEYKLKFSQDQLKEASMVDIAFEILKAANTPLYYRDLMKEIAKVKELSDEEVMDVIAQVYTEINIDGRFACVGTNLWGLKRWYPVEKSDEGVAGGSKRPRIINDEDDDEELYGEEEEGYDPELEDDFDTILDEDEDDFVEADDLDDDLDEDDEADEEVELDEELEDDVDEPLDFDEEADEDER